MAIILETINVGVENQATGSDSLFTAFTKTQNNFALLSNTASPYNTFNGGNGIQTESFSSNGTVVITNTGILNIVPGTGITATNTNGNVVISVSGTATGEIVAGVTNVGISSTTLDVSNSPIISNGVMSVDLQTISNVTPGEYTAATVTVDEFGRITGIANTVSSGTVTSVDFAPGEGIEIAGGPITTTGTITVTNTGVTRINAGPGITLSGHTGEITVSTINSNPGTVTSVEVTSNTLTITGSPITSTGTINIELPESDTMTGNFTAGNITSLGALVATGNANITANVNANNVNVTHNLVVGNSTLGNLTSFDVTASNAMVISNTGYLILNTTTNNNKFVALQAPASISPDYIAWALPSAEGSANSFMSTDGAGHLSFKQPASSSAPSTASSTGVAGQIAYDSTHIYVCIATNSWIRASAAAW